MVKRERLQLQRQFRGEFGVVTLQQKSVLLQPELEGVLGGRAGRGRSEEFLPHLPGDMAYLQISDSPHRGSSPARVAAQHALAKVLPCAVEVQVLDAELAALARLRFTRENDEHAVDRLPEGPHQRWHRAFRDN